MTTQDIYNYRKVNDQVITSGLPTEEQIRSAAQEGFTTVINLVPDSPRTLQNEADLVQSLGMKYIYIPVDWMNPTKENFETFEAAMHQAGGKTLIHCAANFRVTAFYSLYAMKNLGWTPEQAQTFRASIWEGSDYPYWDTFLSEMTADITQ